MIAFFVSCWEVVVRMSFFRSGSEEKKSVRSDCSFCSIYGRYGGSRVVLGWVSGRRLDGGFGVSLR